MKRFALAALMAIVFSVHAQRGTEVEVKSAWARPTVEGQASAGAFMRLTSKNGARIVGASSAVAGVVEIHEMKMVGNVMQMRPLDGLDLPPGSAVELRPGAHHLMLMDLKRPLKVGEKIKVELRLQTRDKSFFTQPVEIEIRTQAP